MRCMVAQIGARRHYAVPLALYRAGSLEWLCTDTCANKGWGWATTRMVPAVLHTDSIRRLAGRIVPEIPTSKIRALPWWGIGSRVVHMGRSPVRKWLAANQLFCRMVVRRGFEGCEAVYVFNQAGLEIMEAAKRAGKKVILDQTSAPTCYERTLEAEERERWPQWFCELQDRDGEASMVNREETEWKLADLVICGSSFVAGAVAQSGGPSSLCRVCAYGIDPGRFAPLDRSERHGPIRVLFVGKVAPMKGVQYLLDAVSRLDTRNIEVRLVGPLQVAAALLEGRGLKFEVLGPVPRTEMPQQYAWADVFVLPTLCEGSASVCYEAMATGLPVITTTNAGSVVRDGVDGFVVPIRDSKALAEKLETLILNTDMRLTMGQNAASRVRDYTWAAYEHRLMATLAGVVHA